MYMYIFIIDRAFHPFILGGQTKCPVLLRLCPPSILFTVLVIVSAFHFSRVLHGL